MKVSTAQLLGDKWIVIRELSLAGAKGEQGSGLSKSSCQTEDKKETRFHQRVTGDISLEL